MEAGGGNSQPRVTGPWPCVSAVRRWVVRGACVTAHEAWSDSRIPVDDGFTCRVRCCVRAQPHRGHLWPLLVLLLVSPLSFHERRRLHRQSPPASRSSRAATVQAVPSDHVWGRAPLSTPSRLAPGCCQLGCEGGGPQHRASTQVHPGIIRSCGFWCSSCPVEIVTVACSLRSTLLVIWLCQLSLYSSVTLQSWILKRSNQKSALLAR